MNVTADTLFETPLPDSHVQGSQTDMSMLTTILQSADQIYTSLPGEELFHIPRNQAAQYQEQMSQRLQLQKTLERFMEALQQLDLIYPIILARTTSRDADFREFCEVQNCVHHTKEPPPPGSRSEQPNQFDYTLVQLLLCCHQRLVDIAEAILEHGAQCYDTSKELNPENMRLDIPEVRIGSLMVSKPTAASVWMNMLQDSLVALQKQLQAIPGLLATVRSPEQEEAKVVELQSKIIARRTQAGVEKLTRFRKSLVELDLLTS
jgi:hypothetical protein